MVQVMEIEVRPLGDGAPLGVEDDEGSEAVGVRGQEDPIDVRSALRGAKGRRHYCSMISSGSRAKGLDVALSRPGRVGPASMAHSHLGAMSSS